MQTFLPYPDFAASASVLDGRRLNKQRLECLQIYKAILDETYGWQHHPAVDQWRGFLPALEYYLFAIEQECHKRGFKSHLSSIKLPLFWDTPWWLGYEPYHASHRASLLLKFPEHYSKFGWDEEPKMEYVWPSKLDRDLKRALGG